MQVYFDNAASTELDPRVFEEMLPAMQANFGNPSSIHSLGRQAKTLVERARKTIAQLLNTSPAEIFFTSGGTEADNTAIKSSVESLGIKRIISSKIEHHAVLHTLEHLEKNGSIQLDFVELEKNGDINLSHLESLLQKNTKTMVSLMHANNEIGNLLPLDTVGDMCKNYNSLFHSDTVQTVGHLKHDLQAINIDYIVGSAHKFHGPKGVGFLYVNANNKITPFVHGGAQERNLRGGTENIYGIIGLAKAMEIAYSEIEQNHTYILSLKEYMKTELIKNIQGITFNGTCGDAENSFFKVLNVGFPPSDNADMMLFNLDINKIFVSGGSACASGTNIGSHVLTELDTDPRSAAVRFSFSKNNTKNEVDFVIKKLIDIVA